MHQPVVFLIEPLHLEKFGLYKSSKYEYKERF